MYAVSKNETVRRVRDWKEKVDLRGNFCSLWRFGGKRGRVFASCWVLKKFVVVLCCEWCCLEGRRSGGERAWAFFSTVEKGVGRRSCEEMTGSRRGKGTSRPSVMMRLSHIVRGERNNVNAIIVPTRLAIQPSSLNEGMRSIVSLPPRVFLQSDPEMLHFRVQEALNEANSHILMQRRYVAQEKALRMDAEKETTRLQTQLKSINSQLSNQALSISTVMEELLDLTDRARIDVETDQRYLPEIHQRLADEAARHASTVLDILRPVLDDAKLAEQRAEKSQKSFDEILIESTNGPLSFLPDERRDGKTGGSDRR